MKIEIKRSEAIDIMHAIAFACKHAKREEDHDALCRIYDRFDKEIKEDTEENERTAKNNAIL